MIVDGLGHVSLDSAPTVAAVNNIQPNIHQGKLILGSYMSTVKYPRIKVMKNWKWNQNLSFFSYFDFDRINILGIEVVFTLN